MVDRSQTASPAKKAGILQYEDVYFTGLPAESAWPPFIDFTVAHAGQDILDIGCGNGEYMAELEKRGYRTAGLDPNPEYVKLATGRGLRVEARGGEDTGHPDDSFDTVLLYEVLEHVPDPRAILKEAARVARRNILVTVPNCEDLDRLALYGITYLHMRTDDHVNFYTRDSLGRLIRTISDDFRIIPSEPMYPERIYPKWSRIPMIALRRLGLLKPPCYYRLYARIDLKP